MRGFLILLAAVLAAIGIGIGAEAAATPPAYGPPGARFTAAFPAAPSRSALGRGGGPIYSGGPPGDRLSVWILPDGRAFSGWVGYAPLSGTGPVLPPRAIPLSGATVNGQRVQLGVSCRAGLCWGLLHGLGTRSGGRLTGFMATAKGSSAGEVRTLLTSLSPLAG